MDEEESDSRQGVNRMSSSHCSEDKLSDFTLFSQKIIFNLYEENNLKL